MSLLATPRAALLAVLGCQLAVFSHCPITRLIDMNHIFAELNGVCGETGERAALGERGVKTARLRDSSGSTWPSLLLSALKFLKLQSQGSLVPRQVGHRGGTDYAVEIDTEQDSDCIWDKRCN